MSVQMESKLYNLDDNVALEIEGDISGAEMHEIFRYIQEHYRREAANLTKEEQEAIKKNPFIIMGKLQSSLEQIKIRGIQLEPTIEANGSIKLNLKVDNMKKFRETQKYVESFTMDDYRAGKASLEDVKKSQDRNRAKEIDSFIKDRTEKLDMWAASSKPKKVLAWIGKITTVIPGIKSAFYKKHGGDYKAPERQYDKYSIARRQTETEVRAAQVKYKTIRSITNELSKKFQEFNSIKNAPDKLQEFQQQIRAEFAGKVNTLNDGTETTRTMILFYELMTGDKVNSKQQNEQFSMENPKEEDFNEKFIIDSPEEPDFHGTIDNAKNASKQQKRSTAPQNSSRFEVRI